MKKKLLIGIIFILILSNLLFTYLYYKSENKLRELVIPNIADDYLFEQINKVKYYKQIEEYRLEFEKGDNALVDNNFSMFLDVPYINQNPKYPNGCESASAVMLLNYFNIDISLEEFINNYLAKDKVYEKSGKRYGPNPQLSYAGDPSTSKGWGAYEPVIINAINKVLTTKNLNNEFKVGGSEQKLSLNELARYYEVVPFIIWVTSDYSEITQLYKWYSYDNKKLYTYAKNEHVVVLTGIDENYYYINDPLTKKNVQVKKEVLEKSFDSMGRQYIGIFPQTNHIEIN